MNKISMLSSLAPLILKNCKKNKLVKDAGILIIGVVIGALGFNNQRWFNSQRPTMSAVSRKQSKTDSKAQTADSGSAKENNNELE